MEHRMNSLSMAKVYTVFNILSAAATFGILAGGSSAIVAVGIKEDEKRKKEEEEEKNKGKGKRHQYAVTYAHRMVREIAAETKKRRAQSPEEPGPAPPGVPQYNWDDCFNQARQANIWIIGPVGDHGIRATGVPPVCMNLATLLGGAVNGTGMPIPCGSDCMDWVNMTPDYYEGVRKMLSAEAVKL
ncbi:hypothetical protein CKAH01_04522 [Colletotrichum kahawae]|uniref:Uncharacterized protein n=1 Tax=Colletotrichum kahawae TaxID=34407 RepID=A0AAD9YH57_COLKA|nr:hypothetical protein CKAH01_04522 [Colletotrichum kahawae]